MESRKVFLNGLRMNYLTLGSGPPMILLHGFPQTSRQWRHIAPRLAERFTVIAPDYRGAGRSDRPQTGYDKRTMAGDIHALVTLLGHDKVTMVGHDIGGMIAYAYAAQFRDAVSKLVVLDVPIPGTSQFDRIVADPRAWHMPFHMVPDVPEMLIAGRERAYLATFFSSKTLNSAAFSESDIDEYSSIYAAPGAMRAGLEIYRAFARDRADNKESMQHKLSIPVLTLGGVGSAGEQAMREMMLELAEDVTAFGVPDSGHYVAEENPDFVVERILEFV